MFPLDSLVFDLLFPATARPTPEQVTEGLGGEDVAKARVIVDVDLDLPQIETELSPTFILRRRGDRRVFIVDEQTAPLRQSRTQPIVARDLRAEKDRLVAVVEKTGARIGRMGTFGTWGDAVVVTRSVRDLRAVMLLSWALDPAVDLDGRRRAQPLGQRELEMKLASFDKRLDELDDSVILGKVPPATLERRGTKDAPLFVVHTLSDRDGSWDIRKSYEVEKRVMALESFSRIPGARQSVAPPEPEPEPAKAAPPPPPEPPKPVGPPIATAEVGDRVILRIPGERLDSELVTTLGKRALDALTPSDAVSRKDRERIEQAGCGFVAPLAFLSEVFIDGKPLDKKRFLAESVELGDGVRGLEALLPRYGAVRVVEVGGKRWITSEIAGDVARLLPLMA